MDAEGTIQLLKEILADQPRLLGAACVGSHQVFDPLPGNGARVHREAERARLTRAAACCGVLRHLSRSTVLPRGRDHHLDHRSRRVSIRWFPGTSHDR